MRQRKYVFKFEAGEIEVYAFNYDEAQILAQAEAIKRGWDYKKLLTWRREDTK